MARVTAAEVDAILERDSSVVSDLTPFITAAYLVVENNLTDSSVGHDDDTLKEIERWLAAHFAAIKDMRVAREQAGPVSEAKQYKVGLNLQVTVYGQQAILLDNSGTLAQLSEGTASTAIVQSIDAVDGGT